MNPRRRKKGTSMARVAPSRSKKSRPIAHKNHPQASGSGLGSAQLAAAQREEEEESSHGNEDEDEEDSNADEILGSSSNNDSIDSDEDPSASASNLVIRIPSSLGLKRMAPIDKPRTDKGMKYAYI
jgi:hypothetical protein